MMAILADISCFCDLKKKIKLDEKCKHFILYFDDFFSSTYIDTVVCTLCFKILAMEAKI